MYRGNRDFQSLVNFARENLKPVCGYPHLDLCDDAMYDVLRRYQVWFENDPEDFDLAIREEEAKIATYEEAFDAKVSELNLIYDDLYERNEARLRAVRDGGLDLMMTVRDSAR